MITVNGVDADSGRSGNTGGSRLAAFSLGDGVQMTKQEFLTNFAREMGVEELPEFIGADPCYCGAPNCDGWWLTFDKTKALEGRAKNKKTKGD